jgi:hypothetical protein
LRRRRDQMNKKKVLGISLPLQITRQKMSNNLLKYLTLRGERNTNEIIINE